MMRRRLTGGAGRATVRGSTRRPSEEHTDIYDKILDCVYAAIKKEEAAPRHLSSRLDGTPSSIR